MKGGSFRSKPSKTHIIWTRESRNENAKKRFDEAHFEKWAGHYGFDFENETRVDHDRGDEPREQYRCVFTWETVDGETLELGDEEWTLGQQKTPRTFVEIDAMGIARVRGWTSEAVLNVVQMRHDGPVLLVETAGEERKRIDGRELATHPRDQA